MKKHQFPLTPETQKYVYDTFSKHAIETTGIDGFAEDPISFEIHQDDKRVGCIVVRLFWGQLHIKYLVVNESCRGQGIGRRLVEQACDYAKERGCHFVFVETLSFQAPEFYNKLGFKVDFVRHGYDKGASFYYLKRELNEPESRS
ncbi:MAG: GNAT family N-acetyltransferase [Alphaproteobacteria bacterium]|jgi:ribosomal protein S18 acetylase RimI-like enzyme|nr:GNAT family N-acetyltransferase [Alphaproteobacteria bacterium]